jgi:hypothetical protein
MFFKVAERLKALKTKLYDDLKAVHVADYRNLRHRLSLNLPGVQMRSYLSFFC